MKIKAVVVILVIFVPSLSISTVAQSDFTPSSNETATYKNIQCLHKSISTENITGLDRTNTSFDLEVNAIAWESPIPLREKLMGLRDFPRIWLCDSYLCLQVLIVKNGTYTPPQGSYFLLNVTIIYIDNTEVQIESSKHWAHDPWWVSTLDQILSLTSVDPFKERLAVRIEINCSVPENSTSNNVVIAPIRPGVTIQGCVRYKAGILRLKRPVDDAIVTVLADENHFDDTYWWEWTDDSILSKGYYCVYAPITKNFSPYQFQVTAENDSTAKTKTVWILDRSIPKTKNFVLVE
ncbi:MAG: hypothetical protein JXA00_03290 [Candidatus Thermoplasmatota archaeon]|nr:hypothetical protein [Candidatus Thermoplasmatota archaeon]